MRKYRKVITYVLVALGALFLLLFFVSISWVGYYTSNDVKETPQMGSYQFDTMFQDSTLQVEYQWVPLDSISRNLIIAVLAIRDENFYIHDGFAPIEEDTDSTIFIPQNCETISQCTAHSVFLTSGETKMKLFLENYFTILEEYMWTKDRILEVYLNTAYLGYGIFGAEAASYIYFGKSAGDLTREEASSLAILYRYPQEEQVDFEFHEDFCKYQTYILGRMGMMTQVKVGKSPIDEAIVNTTKPKYRRNWRG